jgi:glycosyltransferase involved in cell wall biosynthesis
MRRLAFVSYHWHLDPSNGAARTVRTILRWLAEAGWSCAAFTGPRVDNQGARQIGARGLATKRYVVRAAVGAARLGTVERFRDGAVAVTRFAPEGAEPGAEADDGRAEDFASALRVWLSRRPVDIVLTFGGGKVGRAILREAKRAGATTVFALYNDRYGSRDLFDAVDVAVCPSSFLGDAYRRVLGLDPRPLPDPLEPHAIEPPVRAPRFLTFVSPVQAKGLYFATGLFAALGALRPDIPILVVEGRGSRLAVLSTPADLSRHPNLHFLPVTNDPRQIYAVTRAALVPSLAEPSGRVAGEAIVAGVPVVAANAGGLPETLLDAGLLLPIPPRFGRGDMSPPSSAELAPWLRAIVALWDDATFYERERVRCVAARERLLGGRARYLELFEPLADAARSRRAAAGSEAPGAPEDLVRAFDDDDLPVLDDAPAPFEMPEVQRLVRERSAPCAWSSDATCVWGSRRCARAGKRL